MGWRRVSEAVLQIAPSFTNKTFRATSNARNEAMFKEATEFAQNIKVIEKDLKALLKNIDVHFKNLRCILVSPLPRVWDEGPMGVQPLDEETRLLGASMEVEAIPRAAEEARQRIQEEVLNPLGQWMRMYKQNMDKMKMLEDLRLELDSRRRTVANLQGKLERVRSTLGSTRHKGELELRETEDTMARKQDKMENTGDRFMVMERSVYNDLYTLVRDTAVLRDYTLACLKILMEAFEAAVKAYDTPPTAQPPGSTMGTAAGGLTGGQMGYAPENKYEANMPAADRPTPKGFTGLIDRLRGKSPQAGYKVPPSLPSFKDAHDQHDQAPYSGYTMAYAAPAGQQRMPSGYGMGSATHATTSMRPTHESDVPPPSMYIQQHQAPGGGSGSGAAGGQGYGGNGYGPAQVTGGYNGSQGSRTYQTQVTGGSNYGGAPQLPMPPPMQPYPQQPQPQQRSTYPTVGPMMAPSAPQQQMQQQGGGGGGMGQHARTLSGTGGQMDVQQQMVQQQYGRYAPQPVGAGGGGGYQEGY